MSVDASQAIEIVEDVFATKRMFFGLLGGVRSRAAAVGAAASAQADITTKARPTRRADMRCSLPETECIRDTGGTAGGIAPTPSPAPPTLAEFEAAKSAYKP